MTIYPSKPDGESRGGWTAGGCKLYAYLVRKAAELGAFVYAINGCTDHIVGRQKEHHGAGTAVAWLGRCSEIDEGPEDVSSSAASQPVPAVHESHPVYEVPGEPAF